jgi:hypothetical protein
MDCMFIFRNGLMISDEFPKKKKQGEKYSRRMIEQLKYIHISILSYIYNIDCRDKDVDNKLKADCMKIMTAMVNYEHYKLNEILASKRRLTLEQIKALVNISVFFMS